jgi:hypothetical protein
MGVGYGEGWAGRPRHGGGYETAGEDDPGSFGGGAFGVRRPLRFLAYKLELNDAQVSELARILDELKTERAQAAVDHRRALSAFARFMPFGCKTVFYALRRFQRAAGLRIYYYTYFHKYSFQVLDSINAYLLHVVSIIN